MSVIDKLCYNSRLRYINAEVKFAYAILTLLFCIISRSLVIAAIVLTVNGILTVGKGRIPFVIYHRLMLVPLGFLLLSTGTLIVNISKMPLDAYAIPIGSWYLTGSRASLMLAARLILSAFASVSCLYFLSLNTTMTDILGVLERAHCPQMIVELMLLIYRYIFVLTDTASAIQVSQRSRLGYQDFKTSIRSFGQMAAVLFIRSLKRSNALYDAMESRGYDGRIRVLRECYPPRRKEIVLVVLFEIALLVSCIVQIP